MVINFQEQFAEAVENGTKAQTIRKAWKNGKVPWKPTTKLQLYTGLRTRKARFLREAVCLEVEEICFTLEGYIILGGSFLDGTKCYDLAISDGFKKPWPFTSMIEWVEKTHGLPFVGYLIKFQ